MENLQKTMENHGKIGENHGKPWNKLRKKWKNWRKHWKIEENHGKFKKTMEQLKKTMETLKKTMEKLKKTMEKLKRHETQKKIQNCKKKIPKTILHPNPICKSGNNWRSSWKTKNGTSQWPCAWPEKIWVPFWRGAPQRFIIWIMNMSIFASKILSFEFFCSLRFFGLRLPVACVSLLWHLRFIITSLVKEKLTLKPRTKQDRLGGRIGLKPHREQPMFWMSIRLRGLGPSTVWYNVCFAVVHPRHFAKVILLHTQTYALRIREVPTNINKVHAKNKQAYIQVCIFGYGYKIMYIYFII